jgi:hypothetical protein
MSSSRDMLQDYLEDLLKAWVVVAVAGFLGGTACHTIHFSDPRFLSSSYDVASIIFQAPCHPSHCRPSFLDLNGITRR